MSQLWEVPKIWENEECWIIGGGMSVPRQFGVPEGVIDQVTHNNLSPYTYTPWLKMLKDKNVIGTNIAYQLGNLIDVFFFGDPDFFRVHRYGIKAFPNEKVTCANLSNEELEFDGLKAVAKDLRRGIIIGDRKHVMWNVHTGGAAINLAVLFGVKRIYLLGFDMKPDSRGRTHWHGEYGGPIQKRTFDTYLRSFYMINRDAQELGVEILNVNPDSAIEEFEKISLEEVIQYHLKRHYNDTGNTVL